MIRKLQQILQEVTGQPAYALVFPSGDLSPTDFRVTYQVITGSKRYSHQGSVRLANQTVQVTVFSKGYGVATEQLNKINEALNGYREPNGQIKAVFVSGIAPDMHDQDTGIYQKSIDLTFYTRSE